MRQLFDFRQIEKIEFRETYNDRFSHCIICHESEMINVRINIYDQTQIIDNSLEAKKLVDRLSPSELNLANQKNSIQVSLTVH